jgi:hypothetical protein
VQDEERIVFMKRSDPIHSSLYDVCVSEVLMARAKKLEEPVTLFAAIEKDQYDAIRTMAFEERVSLADVVREALTLYIRRKGTKSPRARKLRAVSN